MGFKWVRGKVPELQDHIGAVEIRKSEINGRWLFSTKNMCWVVVIGHQGNSQVKLTTKFNKPIFIVFEIRVKQF